MKTLLSFILLFLSFVSNAQNSLSKSDDIARIVLNTYVPADANIKPAAQKLFESKLNAIVAANGMGGSGASQRFLISGQINELSKNIIVGPPDQIILELEVNLIIGDGIDGTIFATEAINIKAIGDNETKAYIDALKKIKTADKNILAFVEKGKSKIIEYYNSKCDFILKQASSLSDQKSYDNALYVLSEVPEVCKTCYDGAMELAVKVYKAKVENECQLNITKAKAFIAQDNWDEAAKSVSNYTPDMSCYSEIKGILQSIQDHRCEVSLGKAKGAWASRDVETTGAYLSEIPTDSKCYQEAEKVGNEVRAWVKEKDGREWKMIEKIQQDETDIRKEELDVRKKAISAARDVGVAYANNQPRVVYNTRVIRTWYH
ncbi:MAG: hypothetical protein ACKO52_08915 [Sediminibacterium sp.]